MIKKTLLIALAMMAVTTTLFARFEKKLSDNLEVFKLNEKVFIATHKFPWESNSMIVKAGPREVVLIDTPYDTEATKLLLDWVKYKFPQHNVQAINTGFHIDNLGGNEYLRSQNIDIYGSKRTCELIDSRGKKSQQQIISWLKPEHSKIKKVYEEMKFVKPNKLFSLKGGISLHIGNTIFEIFFPGETHSPDNVVVYIKKENLIFGGCMVKALSHEKLGYIGDANLDEWPKSLKILRDKYIARHVVPHHGKWSDMRLIQHTINLLKNHN